MVLDLGKRDPSTNTFKDINCGIMGRAAKTVLHHSILQTEAVLSDRPCKPIKKICRSQNNFKEDSAP